MSSHSITVLVTDRTDNHMATRWAGTCSCKNAFVGPTYEAVEDQWREHCWLVTGRAPDAWGSKTEPRWQPPAGQTELTFGGVV